MALPPSGTTDEAFLREVDEEYRRDQLLGIWRNYGRWIIGAVVVALIAFALYLYLGNRNDSVAGKHGEDYDAALRMLDESQADKALPALDKVAADSRAYAAVARLVQGNVLLEKKDAKGAAAKFAEVANNKDFAQPYRDLALLRQTAAEFDSIKPETAISRLQNLSQPNSPWFGTAGEMVAAAQLKLGKRDEAAKLLARIAQGGENVPDSVRQRVVQLASVLGADVPDQSKEKQVQ